MAVVYRLTWMLIGAGIMVFVATAWFHWPWWAVVLAGIGGFLALGALLAGVFEMVILGGRSPGGPPGG